MKRTVTSRRFSSGYIGVRVTDQYGWTEVSSETFQDGLDRANKTRTEIARGHEKEFHR